MNDSSNEANIVEICDNLIDYNYIQQTRIQHLNDSYESYKRANMLLGYFSQLRDYAVEYECLTLKVFEQRKEVLVQYKDLLTDTYNDIFKQLLISPTKTESYKQGINKYNKVKNYSTYYYRRKMYIQLENDTIDMGELTKILQTIITLDKYYDIYEETINFFMKTSDRFEQILKKHFPDFIHL